MAILFPRCAGVDIHKRTVVACRIVPTDDGEWRRETRSDGTTSEELLRLADWLTAGGPTHVGLERTGEFWKPVCNLLERSCEVWPLNAQHIQAVPGRKTAVRDAEWIAWYPLGACCVTGWCGRASSRRARSVSCQAPPGPMTRHRTNFVRERATLVNRVQQVLEGTNRKLTSVVSNVVGASGRAIRAALLGGATDVVVLAGLAQGKWRKKRDQLVRARVGHSAPHHACLLTELRAQIDGLDAAIARCDDALARHCAAHEQEAVSQLLDTIPGVGRAMAALLVAEVGVDMDRFPTPGHLAAWAGVAPGNNERSGRAGRARATPDARRRWSRRPTARRGCKGPPSRRSTSAWPPVAARRGRSWRSPTAA